VGLEWRLAWRNIWRNSRRTALTLAATVFAVFLVVVFVAMAAGLHGKMIEDTVRVHSGHVQISGVGYLENRTLEQFLRLSPPVVQVLDSVPHLVAWAPRVVAFGLLSKESSTQGVALLGVDPKREPQVSTLSQRLVRGAFLPEGTQRGIVLGERLARNLGADPGDVLLLYSVAWTTEMAYELFTVTGVMRLPEPALDRKLAVLSLSDAQSFFVYGDRISEVAIRARNADDVPLLEKELARRLAASSPVPVEVHGWQEVMPELRQLIFLDDAGMYIMLAILVIVVAFGILNTLLMSVLERRRELGVLLALGLRPASLFRLVYLESLMLAAVGLAIGLALALPAVLLLQGHPIPLGGDVEAAARVFGMEPVVTFRLKPLNPLGSMATVFSVAALAAWLPARKASRARPVDALRGL